MAELGFDTGPFVSLAAFCETVLQEANGVLSLIRVVDTLEVHAKGPDAPDDMPPGVVEATLVVLLRAGRAKGGQTVQINLERPDGSRDDGPEIQVHFPGGEGSGHNLISTMRFEARSQGLYWADVVVNKRLMTRVPLQVKYGFLRTPGERSSP